MKHEWNIIDERFVLEDQKGYPLMKVVKGKMHLAPIELAYGPYNIQRREQAFISWLKLESQTLQKVITFHNDDDKRRRLEWIETYVKNS
jgi:tRNA A22 N-methylase